MTPAVPTPTDRRLYGDLVDAVYELRAAGQDVARFKGDYRVGKDVLTAAELRAKAAELRNRRQARKPDAPRAPMARHEITKTNSRAAGGDEGRDAVRQGSAAIVDDLEPNAGAAGGADAPAPIEETAERNTPPGRDEGTPESNDRAGIVPADLCGCGRPDAHGGRCWARRGWPGPDKGPTAIKRAKEPARVARDGNIAALWAEVDALKSAAARIEKAVADLRGLLSMEGLR